MKSLRYCGFNWGYRRSPLAGLCVVLAGVILVGLGSSGSMSADLGSWRDTGPMKSANFKTAILLSEPGCGSNCGKVFAGNGGWWGTTSKSQLYNPKTDQWELTQQLPAGHPGHVGGAFALLTGTGCAPHCGKVLAAGGTDHAGNTGPTLQVDLYDPATDSWSPAEPLLWVGPESATTLPDGRVLVLGYHGGSTYSQAVRAQIFDPATGRWEETDRSKVPLVGGWTADVLTGTNCAPHCGKVLVAGNFDTPVSGPGASAKSQLFEPNLPGLDFPGQKGRWAITGSMTVPRREHASASLPDGRVMAVGGFGGVVSPEGRCPDPDNCFGEGLKSDVAEIYDPQTEKWTVTSQMATTRSSNGGPGMTLTPVRCGLLAAGGHVGGGTSIISNVPGEGDEDLRGPTASEAELYLPAASNGAGAWTATAPMKNNRALHSATLLPDGRVLVAGGLSRSAPVASADESRTIPTSEIYTPGDLCSLTDADLDLPPVVTAVVPAKGPTTGGTPVTVTGQSLSKASEVRFGTDLAMGLAVVSDTEIKAVSPAHAAGVVHVTVQTPAGVSADTLLDQFTYEEPGAPAAAPQGPEVTGIEPRRGPVSGGTEVSVVGTNLGGAAAVVFDAKPITRRCNGEAGSGDSPCFEQSSDEQLKVFTPAATGPGQVHIQVQTQIGTSPRTPADLFEYISAKVPLDTSGLSPASSVVANIGINLGGGSPMTPAPPGGALSTVPAGSSAGSPVTSSQASMESMVSPVPVAAPGAAPMPGGTTAAVPGFAVAPQQDQQQAAPESGSTYNMVGRQRPASPALPLAAASMLTIAWVGIFATRRSGRDCLGSSSQHQQAAWNPAW